MKRLLITCEYPPIVGGQGSYFKNLWSNLDPDENIILVPATSRGYLTESEGTNFEYVLIPTREDWPSRIIRLFLLTLKVFLLCLKLKPKELHFGQLVVGGACGFCMKILFRIPYIVHCHGADLLEFTNHKWARPFLKLFLKNSYRIIANSNYTKNRIVELYSFSEKTKVVNPSVDSLFFNYNEERIEQLRNKYNLKDKVVLLTTGRLVERKGHDSAIKALPMLKQHIPNLIYLIVGDGPNRIHLEELIRQKNVEKLWERGCTR